MRKKAWFLILIVAFSLMGSAYGAWTQVISVSSTITTAIFDGAINFEEGDDLITLNESNYRNNYSIMISRQYMTGDTGAFSQSDVMNVQNHSSIPTKFKVHNKTSFSSSVTVIYHVTPKPMMNKSSETDEPLVERLSKEIAIPSDYWTFSVDCSHDTYSNLTYNEFIDTLRACLNNNMDSDSSHSIRITETLTDGLSDFIHEKVGKGSSIIIETFEVDWSYGYDIQQVPFNYDN